VACALDTFLTAICTMPTCVYCDTRYAAGFGNLRSLVKLQASFNPFIALPADLWRLPQLELFRLAVGHLAQWPSGLAEAGQYQVMTALILMRTSTS
jgi:hypothetical protein